MPQTLTVVSTENVFNLEFINKKARDLLAERLNLFIMFFLVTKKIDDAGADDEEEAFEADVDI